MVSERKDWYSLTEASELMGVHPSTLRRWADAGSIPHLRTPGGHRRFRAADLTTWMQGGQTAALASQSDRLVRAALGHTRQEIAAKRVSGEAWYRAFAAEQDREQMRAMGQQLFGLAIQYMVRAHHHEPVLQDARSIGAFYGEQCEGRGVGLADTMRAMFFFRESLLEATQADPFATGETGGEALRIYRQLYHFLDEVMVACLTSYEASCRRGLPMPAPDR
jgi:excisionase family DNA binding protein